QFCWIIQSLPPNVWLNCAPAAAPAAEQPFVAVHLWVAPKLKLHLSAFSSPLLSNHAFRSGSEIASSCSWVRTLIKPSAPPTPVAGLLGPVVWISHPDGQRSGLPIKPHLMSVPLRV